MLTRESLTNSWSTVVCDRCEPVCANRNVGVAVKSHQVTALGHARPRTHHKSYDLLRTLGGSHSHMLHSYSSGSWSQFPPTSGKCLLESGGRSCVEKLQRNHGRLRS